MRRLAVLVAIGFGRQPATTLTEAQQRARSLYQRLASRGVHGEVLRYCTAELLADNYFHAVLEATKGLFERLRERTGLQVDGGELVDRALGIPKGGGIPSIAFNSLRTESERSEQKGLVNLFKGVCGAEHHPGCVPSGRCRDPHGCPSGCDCCWARPARGIYGSVAAHRRCGAVAPLWS
jgi:uncharacterized protein (TIGR02391 family)